MRLGGMGRDFGHMGNVLGSARGITGAQKATLSRLKVAAASALGNNAVTNADMASPPTITTASTTNAALTVKKYPSVDTTLFTVSPGAKWRRVANNRLYVTQDSFAPSSSGSLNAGFPGALMSPTTPSNGYDNSNNWEFRFVTSSAIVEVEFQPTTGTENPYRFIVDEGSGPAYVARDGQLVSSTTNQFVTLTFGSSIPRTITVEVPFGGLAGGVAVSTGQTITAPAGTVLNAGWTGDSFAEAINVGKYDGSNNPAAAGTTKFWSWDGMASQFIKRVGVTHGMNSALGGTGYTTTSTRSKIVDQIDYFGAFATLDLFLFVGGYNDSDSPTNTANALAAWRKLRQYQPSALIVVFEPWGGRTGPNANATSMGTNFAAQFAAWADPCSMFIPIVNDPGGAWLTGTGFVGGETGAGNCDIYISTDGQHPNRGPAGGGGMGYLGGKMDTAYRAKLATMLTALGL